MCIFFTVSGNTDLTSKSLIFSTQTAVTFRPSLHQTHSIRDVRPDPRHSIYKIPGHLGREINITDFIIFPRLGDGLLRLPPIVPDNMRHSNFEKRNFAYIPRFGVYQGGRGVLLYEINSETRVVSTEDDRARRTLRLNEPYKKWIS